jgi:hypothetical protein
MQGPWDDDALGGLDRHEQMVNTFAENAQLLTGDCGDRWDGKSEFFAL